MVTLLTCAPVNSLVLAVDDYVSNPKRQYQHTGYNSSVAPRSAPGMNAILATLVLCKIFKIITILFLYH